MRILRKIGIVIGCLLVLFLSYFAIYNIIFNLPNKNNATELDLTNNANLFYLDENNYEQERYMAKDYISVYKADGVMRSADDKLNLAYSKYLLSDAKATIVISHGYTENRDKYEEVIYYYLLNGYNVYMMDHRGHGKSDREVKDNSLVYVSSLHKYSDDLAKFINTVVKTEVDNKIIIYAHSMGGGITADLLQRYDDICDLAVLSAPMIGADYGMPEAIAAPIIKTMNLFKSKDYAIMNSAYDEEYEYNLEDYCTSSEARSYYAYLGYSEEHNQLWGASYGWLNASLTGCHEIQKKRNIKKIDTKVLLFQAGLDTLVRNDAQNQFAKYLKDVTFYKVSFSKHEIWNERNEIMIPYFNTIFTYLEKNIYYKEKS